MFANSNNLKKVSIAWKGKIGTFTETYYSKLGVIFEWKIPGIISVLPTKSTCYTSPSLKFMDTFWYLYFYPKGRSGTSKWISIMVMKSHLEQHPVRITIRIKRADGSEEDISRLKKFPINQRPFVLEEFLHSPDLSTRKSQLAPSGELTITCALWTDAPLPRLALMHAICESRDEFEAHTKELEREDFYMQSICTLRKHLKHLLYSAEDYDVTIRVRDRIFGAHKCILRARSTVFEAMFRHEMKESTDRSISIEDCEPDDFEQFLHYIYTGQVEYMSFGNAMELYYTADKYDVPCLKETCIHFLKSSISVDVFCNVITLATKYDEFELLQRVNEFFVKNAKEILATEEWRCFVRTNPDEANELFTKCFDKMQENSKK